MMIDISQFTEEEVKEQVKQAAPPAEIPAPGEQPGRLEIPQEQPPILAPETVAPPTTGPAPKPEPEQKDEPTPEEKRKLAEKNASMLVNVTDLLVSRLCSLLSGEDHERYKLHKIEKEEYKEAAAAYFETLKTKVSPALIFFTSTLTIFSGILFKAWGDRKRKIKERETAAKLEAERKAAQEQRTIPTGPPAQEPRPTTTEPPAKVIRIEKGVRKAAIIYKEEVPEAMEARSNFEIFTEADRPEGVSSKWDDKIIGYYKKSAENERLKYEDVLKDGSRPSPLLERLIFAELQKGKEWRLINKELRHYIKSLPSFDD